MLFYLYILNKDIQICGIYYIREALRYIKNKKLLSFIRKQAYILYKSKTKDEFLNKLNSLKKEYQNKEPKFFKILLKQIEKTLTFYNYPEKYHSLLIKKHQSNRRERFFKRHRTINKILGRI